MRKKQTFPLFGVGFAVVPRLLGKGKDRGFEHFRSNCAKECRDWPAVIGQSQLEINLARRWHTFGGRRTPPGGATAASPFVCKNVGELPCIESLHLQDCIAEGTWGNESPHFGYNLPRLCYEFKTRVRNTFLPKEPRKRRTFSKNRSQNPLKSRLERSKTPFLKIFNLRRLQRSCGKTLGKHFEPTWLQVGDPRPSKIEAKTRKNGC